MQNAQYEVKSNTLIDFQKDQINHGTAASRQTARRDFF